MNRLGMVGLLGITALLGNLTVDWLTHTKPILIELVGASIIGMILGLALRK